MKGSGVTGSYVRGAGFGVAPGPDIWGLVN